MTPFEESLKEMFLSYLSSISEREKRKTSIIYCTISMGSQPGGIFGCPESKEDSFFLTATLVDGEISSLTISPLPSINSWKAEE
jgi:hypothetical protein